MTPATLPGLDPDTAHEHHIQPSLEQAVPFTRYLVRAVLLSEFADHMVEFDARPGLAATSDADLVELADAWFIGDTPAFRRLAETSGDDGHAFFQLVDGKQGWTLALDIRRASDWIRSQRPHLSNHIDPDMIPG